MTDHDINNKPPDWEEFKSYPFSDDERKARISEMVTKLKNELTQEFIPAAVVSDIHMSRYTIEWVNGTLPIGTTLFYAIKDKNDQ